MANRVRGVRSPVPGGFLIGQPPGGANTPATLVPIPNPNINNPQPGAGITVEGTVVSLNVGPGGIIPITGTITLTGDVTGSGGGTNPTIGTNVVKAHGVTFPTSVTSGGVPYYDSATSESSSAVLATNGLVFGGGAGSAPFTQTWQRDSNDTLSANSASAAIHVITVDNALPLATAGATMGIRFTHNSTGSFIQGVDSTWVTAFEPISIAGSIVSILGNGGSTGITVQGGMIAGAPTGGDQGAGTINVPGGYYMNGVRLGDTVTSTILGASAISITAGVSTNLTSISLGAGTWRVEGNVVFIPTNAGASGIFGISSASASLADEALLNFHPGNSGADLRFGGPAPMQQVTGPATAYMVAQVYLTSGTCTFCGSLSAVRVFD